MAISLSKGGNVSLSKTDPTLDVVMVGLGWDARSTDGKAFDLDASAFLLNAAGKVRTDADFCFYNNKKLGDYVEHQGDNLTGEGDGDDEQIKITLSKIPADVDKLPITVTIHEGGERGQTFGQVSNASIRLVNAQTGVEVLKFDLSEDASTETAMVFGELYRHGAEWKFRAVGQGYNGGLAPLARNYGINIG